MYSDALRLNTPLTKQARIAHDHLGSGRVHFSSGSGMRHDVRHANHPHVYTYMGVATTTRGTIRNSRRSPPPSCKSSPRHEFRIRHEYYIFNSGRPPVRFIVLGAGHTHIASSQRFQRLYYHAPPGGRPNQRWLYYTCYIYTYMYLHRSLWLFHRKIDKNESISEQKRSGWKLLWIYKILKSMNAAKINLDLFSLFMYLYESAHIENTHHENHTAKPTAKYIFSLHALLFRSP